METNMTAWTAFCRRGLAFTQTLHLMLITTIPTVDNAQPWKGHDHL
jgi:hypothetical protein